MNARKSRFNMAEAKARLPELVQRALLGEEVIITRGHNSLLPLVRLDQPRRVRKPGSAKGQIKLAADFDALPDELKEYV